MSSYVRKLSSSVTIPQKSLFQKNIYVYSSPKIVAPITKKNFINTHLYTINENHVIAFADLHHASFLRQPKTEMCISMVKIVDVVPYLQCTKQDILILEDGICDLESKDSIWYFYNVSFGSLEDEYIDCSIEAWSFKN